MTPGRRWGYPTDASVVMDTHRLLSSAMHSSDGSDWHGPGTAICDRSEFAAHVKHERMVKHAQNNGKSPV